MDSLPSRVRLCDAMGLTADADEAWTQVISALRSSLPGQNGQGSFVDDWMSLELSKT